MPEPTRKTEARRGGLDRFVSRSRLMNYVLAGLISFAQGDHANHNPETTSIADTETEPHEFKPLVPLDQIPQTKTVETDFFEEPSSDITPENISSLQKEYELSSDQKRFARLARIAGAPSAVNSPQDVERFLRSAEKFKPADEEELRDWDEDFLSQVLEAHFESAPREMKIVISDQEELKMYMYWDKAVQSLGPEYEFRGLPRVVNEKTLPKIHKMLSAIWDGNETAEVWTEYCRQLDFQGEFEPQIITPETGVKIITKAYSKLDYSLIRFSGLAETYLSKCEMRDYPALDLTNPEPFLEDLEHFNYAPYDEEEYPFTGDGVSYFASPATAYYHIMSDKMQDIPFPEGYTRYEGLMTLHYLMNADYGPPQRLTGETLVRLADLTEKTQSYGEISDFQQELMLAKIMSKIMEREGFQTITPDNFSDYIKRLTAAYEYAKTLAPRKNQDEYEEFIISGAHFSGELKIALISDPENTSLVTVKDLQKIPQGRRLAAVIFQQAELAVVLPEGEVIIENDKELRALFRDLLFLKNANPDFDPSTLLEKIHYAGKEMKVTSWEQFSGVLSTAYVFPEYPSAWPTGIDEYQKFKAANVDLSDFPIFSADYRSLDELYEQTTYQRMRLISILQTRVLSKKLLERADFYNVPFAVTTETMPEIAKQYSEMQIFFGTEVADLYLKQLEFPGFPSDITEANLVEVAAALRLLRNNGGEDMVQEYASRLTPGLTVAYATEITTDDLEMEFAKKTLADLGLIRVESSAKPVVINITYEPPRSLEDLFLTLNSMEMLKSLHKDEGKATEEKYLKSVDWESIIGDAVNVQDISKIEELRQRINSSIGSTMGDRFLIAVGSSAIEKNPVTWENMEEKLTFCEAYLQVREGAKIDEDVVGLYHMIGMFQASQILKFWQSQGVDFEDKKVAPYVTRLQTAGADIPVDDPILSKIWRSGSQPSYLFNKGLRKITDSDEVTAPETQGTRLTFKPNPERMKPGYEYQLVYNGEELVARVLIGDPKSGAKLDYAVRVGGGLTTEEVYSMYPEGEIAAQAVGSYTTGPQKPADFAIDGGHVENYLISTREGLVIIQKDGTVRIKHRGQLQTTDIAPRAAVNPLHITENLSDFTTFIELAEREGVDVMNSHLLLYQGGLEVGTNSDPATDKRRALVTYHDGRFALVDFEQPLSLYEEAYLLQQAGFESAVNLDTGYYDYSSIYPAAGAPISLGLEDKDGINNKFIFLSEQ
ncbi:MAG: hypothetical protein WC752_01115 [Patescibacteria group bacterium]|jgi:hypothetical protein